MCGGVAGIVRPACSCSITASCALIPSPLRLLTHTLGSPGLHGSPACVACTLSTMHRPAHPPTHPRTRPLGSPGLHRSPACATCTLSTRARRRCMTKSLASCRAAGPASRCEIRTCTVLRKGGWVWAAAQWAFKLSFPPSPTSHHSERSLRCQHTMLAFAALLHGIHQCTHPRAHLPTWGTGAQAAARAGLGARRRWRWSWAAGGTARGATGRQQVGFGVVLMYAKHDSWVTGMLPRLLLAQQVPVPTTGWPAACHMPLQLSLSACPFPPRHMAAYNPLASYLSHTPHTPHAHT